MDRRRFVKTSIMAALANPIHAMTKVKTTKSKTVSYTHLTLPTNREV